MPNDGQLAGIFYDVLGYKLRPGRSRLEMHIGQVRKKLVREYLPLATQLNRELAMYYRPPGGISGRQVACNPDGLSVQFHGLDRFQDIEKFILPEVQRLFDEICETDLVTEVKLGRMAAIAAVLTSEAQSFGDGNTRVSRALYDFVTQGMEGAKIVNVAEVSRHFRPPEMLEDTIMRQNVTALVSSESMRSPLPQGVRYISTEVNERIDENLLRFAPLFSFDGSGEDVATRLEGLDNEDKEGIFHQHLLDAGILGGYDANVPVEVTLRQSLYGAAAWTSAFWEKSPTLPLSKSDSEVLGEASAELLRFRMLSLLRGLANGGDFPLIEEQGGDRRIQIQRWWPSGAHETR